jgi:two-component system LytT family sensor kinase
MTVFNRYIPAENFTANIKIFSSRIFRYLARMVMLYVFSVIFMSFDHTFINDLGSPGYRSNIFSLLFVAYGLAIWEGALRIAKRIEQQFSFRNTTKRLVALSCVLIIYGLISAAGFGFVYGLSDILLFNRYEAWRSFKALSYDMNFGLFLFYMMLLALNGIIVYYKAWKEYQVQTERLMRENIQAKYDALRNQIDPHFFFNSLSVLTNLVYKNADLSADYITQLAKIYRYILDKKFDNLVPLDTELDFLDSYLFLMRIRHQNSIVCTTDIEENVRLNGLIPPATLQMLIENAIKHNRFSTSDPLQISIKNNDGFLVVSNTLSIKLNNELSAGIGLENIRKRYQFTSGRSIGVLKTEAQFLVKLPIIIQS